MVCGRSEIYYALLTGVPVKFSSQFWLRDDEKVLWGSGGWSEFGSWKEGEVMINHAREEAAEEECGSTNVNCDLSLAYTEYATDMSLLHNSQPLKQALVKLLGYLKQNGCPHK